MMRCNPSKPTHAAACPSCGCTCAPRENPSRAPTKGLKIVQPSVRDDERAEGPFLVELRRAVSPAWEFVARARTEPGVERRLHAWHGTRLAPGDLVRVVEGRGRMVWLGFATAAGEVRAAPPLAVEGGRFGDPQWLDPIDGWEGTETTASDLLRQTWEVDPRRLVLVAETAASWALGHRHQDTTVAARHAVAAARAWAMGEGSAADAAKASRAADAANPARDRAIEAAARAGEIPGAKAHLQRGLAVGAVIAAEGVVRGQLLARMVRPHLPLATVLAARLGLADPLPLTAIRSNPHTPPRARPSARPKARR